VNEEAEEEEGVSGDDDGHQDETTVVNEISEQLDTYCPQSAGPCIARVWD
jgi:hypothetical protein